MRRRNQDKKNILVPVTEDDQAIPVNKLVKLSKGLGSKIHLAGFISNKRQQVESLFRQTLKMTLKIEDLNRKMRFNGCKVSSKIYMNTFKKKAREVIEDQNIGVITSSINSVYKINDSQEEPVHLLLNNSENGKDHQNILFLHPVDKEHSRIVAFISRLFGNNLYMVQNVNKSVVNDIKEHFDQPLDPKLAKPYSLKELKKWLSDHEPGLIVMKKEHVKKNNEERRLIKNLNAPVLLY